MKRNLSSQAIKAMAIAMAVSMGTSTVVSGTVVNAYAMDMETNLEEEESVNNNDNVTVTVANGTDTNAGNVVITLAAASNFTLSTTTATADAGLTSNTNVKDGFTITAGASESITNFTATFDNTNSNVTITIPIDQLTGKNTVKLSYDSTNVTGAEKNILQIAGPSGFSEEDIQSQSSPKPLVLSELIIVGSGKPNNVTGKLDITAPTLNSPSYSDTSGKTVTINADEPLTITSQAVTNGNIFSITGAPSKNPITITSFTVNNNGTSGNGQVVLNLDGNTNLTEGTTYTIAYTAPNDNNAIKDAKGNKLATIANGLTFTVGDEGEPATKADFTTASIDNTKKIITLNSETAGVSLEGATIGNGQNPDKAGFAIKQGQTDITATNKITNIKVNSGGKERNVTNTIELTLTTPLADGDYTISYKEPSSPTIENISISQDITLKVGNPTVEEKFEFTNGKNTYKFEQIGETSNVALVGFTTTGQQPVAEDNKAKFENGKFTSNVGKTYTLTQIGTPTTQGSSYLGGGSTLTDITDNDLAPHINNVTTINDNAFASNVNIKNLTFPNVTTVGTGAFSGATQLTTLNLPKVTTVGTTAFKGATALTTVDLGSQANKTTVADNAFSGNTNLEKVVTNPTSQKDVADAVKNSDSTKNPGVISITSDNYNKPGAKIENNKYYKTLDGLTFVGLNDTDLAFIGKSSFKTPTVENSLDGSSIDKAYLVNYSNGTVTLKGGQVPTPIENFVYTDSTNSAKLIFNKLSNDTVALTSIESNDGSFLPESAGNTFTNGVLTVNGKPYKLTQMGDGSKAICNNTINVNTVLGNHLNNVTTIRDNAFSGYAKQDGGRTLQNLTIAFPTVTSVGNNAFKGATAFSTINLPNATSIGTSAFQNASELTTVTIPKVTSIPNNTFNGASKLATIDLSNVTTIGVSAFSNAAALTDVSLPNVTTIGINAFSNAGTSSFTIYLGDKVTSIGIGAFQGAGGDSGATVNTNSEAVKDLINNGNTGASIDNVKNPAPFIIGAEVGNDKVIKVTVSEDVEISKADPETLANTVNDWFVVTTKIENEDELAVLGASNIQKVEIDKVNKNIINITLTAQTELDWRHTVTLKHKDPNSGSATSPIVEVNGGGAENAKQPLEQTKTAINVKNTLQKPNPITISPEQIQTKVRDNGSTLALLIPNSVGIQVVSNLAENTGFKLNKSTLSGGSYTSTDVTPTKVDITKDSTTTTVKLTFGTALTGNDHNLKLSYDGSNNNIVALKEDGLLHPIAAVTNVPIYNQEDKTAPTINATGKYEKGKITLTASEYLLPLEKTTAINSLFTITPQVADLKNNTTPEVTIKNVSIAKDSKDIILEIDDTKLKDTTTSLKITYTAPTEENKPQIIDTSGNRTTTNDNITVQIGSEDLANLQGRSISTFATTGTNTSGDVTTIKKDNGATLNLVDIQSMLTNKLTTIGDNTLEFAEDVVLDFKDVIINNTFSISPSAFGNSKNKVTFKNVNSTEELILAKKLKGAKNVIINNKTPDQIIDNNGGGNNGGGSGGGSSSGGGSWSGGSGGGASLGNAGNNTQNNNNNTTNNKPIVENKTLSLDVINLPSISGEPKVFSDVSANYWAKPHIDKLSTAGIINGSNGNFNPNGQTKRADVTIMLVNLLGLTPEVNNKFLDVNPNSYYAGYVGTASSYSIVNGSNGMFNPEGVISRQDTMVMIAQILKGLELNVNTDTTALTQFSDTSSISPYANESVAILVNSGIISGNNGKLNPKAPVTRAEMATIMSKLYDVLASAK